MFHQAWSGEARIHRGLGGLLHDPGGLRDLRTHFEGGELIQGRCARDTRGGDEGEGGTGPRNTPQLPLQGRRDPPLRGNQKIRYQSAESSLR